MKIHNHGEIELVDVLGDDWTPVRAARVSYGSDALKGVEDDTKLLRYLIKNRHTSPFEQVATVWKVKAPIFVFREWHRHRTAKLNEMSGRYTEFEREFYIPNAWRQPSKKNKQSSVLTAKPEEWQDINFAGYEMTCNQAFDAYESLLKRGVAKEQARMVLPVSTYSQMIWQSDLHNLWHFLNLRTHPRAQLEIREYATAMVSILRSKLPILMGIWEELRDK